MFATTIETLRRNDLPATTPNELDTRDSSSLDGLLDDKDGKSDATTNNGENENGNLTWASWGM